MTQIALSQQALQPIQAAEGVVKDYFSQKLHLDLAYVKEKGV